MFDAKIILSTDQDFYFYVHFVLSIEFTLRRLSQHFQL